MAKTIGEYCAQFPGSTQVKLKQVLQAVRAAAPGAEETISYGIPTFKLLGKNLVHFAGWKSHVGFYPTSSGIAKFEAELGGYEVSRGTVKFPLAEPLPLKLIQRITKFRVQEVRGRAAAKAKKK